MYYYILEFETEIKEDVTQGSDSHQEFQQFWLLILSSFEGIMRLNIINNLWFILHRYNYEDRHHYIRQQQTMSLTELQRSSRNLVSFCLHLTIASSANTNQLIVGIVDLGSNSMTEHGRR